LRLNWIERREGRFEWIDQFNHTFEGD
jgi:hypothetical protein